ncbi:MAG: hypothetical protein AAGI25_12995 [Bacteroidota bacterium]
MEEVGPHSALFLTASHRSGNYYVDATKLPVCHYRRIHSHRVVSVSKKTARFTITLFLNIITIPLVADLIDPHSYLLITFSFKN